MATPIDPTSAAFLIAENRSMPMPVGGLQLVERPADAGRGHIRAMFEAMRDVEEVRPRTPSIPIARSAPMASSSGRTGLRDGRVAMCSKLRGCSRARCSGAPTSYEGRMAFIGCRRTVAHLHRLLSHLDDEVTAMERAAGP